MRLLLAGLVFFCAEATAQLLRPSVPEGFGSKEWTVDGVKRTALVRLPLVKSNQPAPVVFGWHGHKGSSANSIRSWGIGKLWPEAVFIFPQGLPTASPLVDKEGRFPGWQTKAGAEGDRDLKFFDAMLASLPDEQKVDNRRVYSTGHSNGSVFSYLLWATRGEKLAAIATVAGVIAKNVSAYQPLPVLHVAGENDPLVKFEWQQATFTAVKKINGCAESPQSWGEASGLKAELFTSSKGAPLVTVVHSGKHEYPPGAGELIIRFLKENTIPAK